MDRDTRSTSCVTLGETRQSHLPSVEGVTRPSYGCSQLQGSYTVKDTVQTVNLAPQGWVGSIPTLPTILKTNNMIPKVGEFYYIDYTDHDQPEGSFFGIAECVKIFDRSQDGKRVDPPMYEFKHQDKKGNMCLSLFYEKEIMFKAQ